MIFLWAIAGIVGASAIQLSKLRQLKASTVRRTAGAKISPYGVKPTWEEFTTWEPSDVIRNVGVWISPLDWVATKVGLPAPTDLLTDLLEGDNGAAESNVYTDAAKKGVTLLDSFQEGENERHGAGSGQAIMKRVFAEIAPLYPAYDPKRIYNSITDREFFTLVTQSAAQVRAFVDARQQSFNLRRDQINRAGF